jgi:DNA ligase-1
MRPYHEVLGTRGLIKLPTLYKKDKSGNIRVWQIYTNIDTIYTEHGQQGGKIQLTSKVVTGKNIGKKNETTVEQQAQADALSMWKKQLDKGYVEDINNVDKIVYLPMLASDFEKRKHKIKYPVHVQPKLDGVRCLTMWAGDRIKLISRKGKEYNVPHIAKELEAIIPPNVILDGEIYLHETTFQEVTRLVKKYREGQTERLKYWVYDAITIGKEDAPWFIRKKNLSILVSLISNSIVLTPTSVAWNESQVYQLQKDFIEDNFEGAIVRETSAPYEINKRSRHLLKVKTFKDNEYKIVDFYEGVGKFKGCVTWVCITPEDKRFSVVPKGTLKQKKEWFQEGEKHINSWLKVKFFELSEDNIPRFPVGLGIRDPRDM